MVSGLLHSLNHDIMQWGTVGLGLVGVCVVVIGVIHLIRLRENPIPVTEAVGKWLWTTGDLSSAFITIRASTQSVRDFLSPALLRAPIAPEETQSLMEHGVCDRLAAVRRIPHALGVVAGLCFLFAMLGAIGGTMTGMAPVSCIYPLTREEMIALGISNTMYHPLVGIFIASTLMVARKLIEARMEVVAARYQIAAKHLSNQLEELRPWLRFHGLRPPDPTKGYRT